MKLIEIARAYMELDKIAAQELPLNISYQVMRIQNTMRDSYSYYVDKENEMLQKHQPDEIRGNRALFKDPETWEKYEKEHSELDEIEADIRFKPLALKETDPIKLTADGLKILTDAGVVLMDGEPEAETGCDCCGKE